ncbi:hypothetical protein [Ponticoccus litoralis]|uniref:Uncharacterized protein n=1 Tax=Ponticoccus litoralis TaxID=422297 RepID=A0AAW9SPR6_9RHOB
MQGEGAEDALPRPLQAHQVDPEDGALNLGEQPGLRVRGGAGGQRGGAMIRLRQRLKVQRQGRRAPLQQLCMIAAQQHARRVLHMGDDPDVARQRPQQGAQPLQFRGRGQRAAKLVGAEDQVVGTVARHLCGQIAGELVVQPGLFRRVDEAPVEAQAVHGPGGRTGHEKPRVVAGTGRAGKQHTLGSQLVAFRCEDAGYPVARGRVRPDVQRNPHQAMPPGLRFA